MLKLLFAFLLSALTGPALAIELPEYLASLLDRSDEIFEIYSRKSSAEIDDGSIDDSDRTIFAQVDQANGLDVMFDKYEIREFRVKLVLQIALKFDSDQLLAISKIGKHPKLNKKKAARYFEVAREYKEGELKENRIYQEIQPRFFP